MFILTGYLFSHFNRDSWYIVVSSATTNNFSQHRETWRFINIYSYFNCLLVWYHDPDWWYDFVRNSVNCVLDSGLHCWIYEVLISELISILLLKNGKKKRRAFSSTVKRQVLHDQKGKCANCKHHVSKETIEYHHKNNDRSNNKLSNCEMLCPTCHSKITRHKNAL